MSETTVLGKHVFDDMSTWKQCPKCGDWWTRIAIDHEKGCPTCRGIEPKMRMSPALKKISEWADEVFFATGDVPNQRDFQNFYRSDIRELLSDKRNLLTCPNCLTLNLDLVLKSGLCLACNSVFVKRECVTCTFFNAQYISEHGLCRDCSRISTRNRPAVNPLVKEAMEE